MLSRIRIAIALSVAAMLLSATIAFAKGGFDYISISGGKLKDEMRVMDPALTTDFFAFADFFKGSIDAPADPGMGYKVTRCYLQGRGSVAFDSLHYYPETGLVYYDGIAGGGWSEYDEKWYTAKPGIRTTFKNTLAVLSTAPPTFQRTKSLPALFQRLPLSIILITIGGAATIIGAARSRKSSVD